MHIKMNAYMAKVLGDGVNLADDATVDAIRLLYWKKYGATLLGLIEHHQIDPADFLRYAHEFENLSEMVRYESGLKRLLNRLPGHKILFTNAPRHYAQQIIRHLGLQNHFNQHISIESMRVHRRLRPKPSRWLLKKMIAQKKLSARRCVLIEDSRDNLRAAKQLGMKTVWVTQYVNQDSVAVSRFARATFIDVKIRSIKQLPAHFPRLFNRV